MLELTDDEVARVCGADLSGDSRGALPRFEITELIICQYPWFPDADRPDLFDGQ